MNNNSFDLKNRKFNVKPVVIGQMHQLQKKCGIDLSTGAVNEEGINTILNDVKLLAVFIAIIVIEDGVTLQEKKLDELTEFFLWNTGIEEMQKILKLFFDAMKSRDQNILNSGQKEKAISQEQSNVKESTENKDQIQ